MIYRITLPVPPSTPQQSLAASSLSIPPGVLTQEFLTFPDGCAGLVGARIVVREHVLWPSNPDQWFINNDYTYNFEDPLEIVGSGETFRLEAYNSDQVHQHTLYLALTLPAKVGSDLAAILATLPQLADLGGV